MTLKTSLFMLLAIMLQTGQSSAQETKESESPQSEAPQVEQSEGQAKSLEEHHLEEYYLEKNYQKEIIEISAEKVRLISEMKREIKLRQAAQRSSLAKVPEHLPKDDDRLVALSELRNREADLLEKLILLNPKPPEYRFRLACNCLERREMKRGLAILDSISPLDKPGFVPGHLFLAKYYMRTIKTSSELVATANIDKAIAHVDICLSKDKSSVEAIKLKSSLLVMSKRYDEAYKAFERLSALDPNYFFALYELNIRLKRPEDNPKLLADAIDQFDQILSKQKAPSDLDSIGTWKKLTRCYVLKKDFETIEDRLLEEIKVRSKQAGGLVWAKRLLVGVYVSRIREYPETTVDSLRKRLEFAKKAFLVDGVDGENKIVLHELARLGHNENEEISIAARNVYDPTTDEDAPAVVLYELGTQAIFQAKYDSAIRYLEMVRQKVPQNPEMLNNLAHAYLVISSPDPKRALKLVDEALRYLPDTAENAKNRSFFHHTRGKAMMLLGRMPEAIKELEISLRERPDNENILASLIKCRQASGLDSSSYEEKLLKIKERDVQKQ